MKRLFVGVLAACALATPAVASAATYNPSDPLVQKAVAQTVQKDWTKNVVKPAAINPKEWKFVPRLRAVKFSCAPDGGSSLTCTGTGIGGVTVAQFVVVINEQTAQFHTAKMTVNNIKTYLEVRLS